MTSVSCPPHKPVKSYYLPWIILCDLCNMATSILSLVVNKYNQHHSTEGFCGSPSLTFQPWWICWPEDKPGGTLFLVERNEKYFFLLTPNQKIWGFPCCYFVIFHCSNGFKLCDCHPSVLWQKQVISQVTVKRPGLGPGQNFDIKSRRKPPLEECFWLFVSL